MQRTRSSASPSGSSTRRRTRRRVTRRTTWPSHSLEGAHAEEGWRVRKDGSRFWASVVISTVYDDAGTHIGFAKVTRDQSMQKQHEQDLNDAVAEQAQFLSVTAHELRTPTAVIEGSATALEEFGEDDADARETLFANIRSSAARLRRLAADLATASQVQRGTLRYEWEDVAVGQLLQRAASRARVAGSDVRLEPQQPPAPRVRADSVRLAQAVDNLLDNALRHGKPPVTLGCSVDESTVSIRVTDGGAGVPARLAPNLFDRFVIGGPHAGTGLGLYLVREIVRAHDGEVEHHPPRGDRPNRFEIRLPVTGLRYTRINPGAARRPAQVAFRA